MPGDNQFPINGKAATFKAPGTESEPARTSPPSPAPDQAAPQPDSQGTPTPTTKPARRKWWQFWR
jgi:hypothetical protein